MTTRQPTQYENHPSEVPGSSGEVMNAVPDTSPSPGSPVETSPEPAPQEPLELPQPQVDVVELKQPQPEPPAQQIGAIEIADDDWNAPPTQQPKASTAPSDDIPRLSDLDEEPEMLSVTTHPAPLEPVAQSPAPHTAVPDSVPPRIESSDPDAGPRLSLKKLHTNLEVDPRGLSASAAAVTTIIEESESPYVRHERGVVSLEEEEIPHIGRVGLAEDEFAPSVQSIIPPELEQLVPEASPPQQNPGILFYGSEIQPAPAPPVEPLEAYTLPPRPVNPQQVQNSEEADLLTPDYRTGLLAVSPRATQEIRRLIRSMETPNVRIRKASLLRLCNKREEADSALPAVRELLFDPDESIRVLAAYSLWRIGNDASGMLTLTDVVVTGSPENSCLAAYALGEIGPAASEALPLLEHIAANGNGLMKLHACEALWRIRHGDDHALNGMISLLKSGDVHERWLATYMIRSTGSKRLDMIHELSTALDDSSTIVRISAGFALGSVGPEAEMAVPRLISIFENSEFEDALRVTAFEALTEIQPLTAAQFRKNPRNAPGRIQPVGRQTLE